MDIITATSTKTQYNLIQDDILHWAASYTGKPYHAILCDPPYHLTTITKRFGKPDSAPAKAGVYNRASKGFMGTDWDGLDEQGQGIAFQPETWAALGEHLYPGGFLMAFAGTRGYHRMACAIEDAGFIIHPALVWTFLSGFPKATRIDTQIDKAAGNVRPDKLNGGHIGMGRAAGDPDNCNELENLVPHIIGKGNHTNGTPIDPMAQIWAGHRYGLQALKPALEFIAVAQKPYEGRPIDCITQTGAGALNIEAGRIASDGPHGTRGRNKFEGFNGGDSQFFGETIHSHKSPENDLGRWPANLILDEAGAALLDRQSGIRPAGGSRTGNEPSAKTKNVWGDYESNNHWESYGDSGGASRMFFQSDWRYEILEQLENADPLHYEPKVSTAERNAGLDDPNPHPTLKPISLTKYLSSLLLPPDAYAPRRILCPFSGSGSEMIGAILAGWDEVTGIEKTPAYIPVAEKRLKWWSQWPGWGQTDVDKILASIEPKEEQAQAVQIGMFQ